MAIASSGKPTPSDADLLQQLLGAAGSGDGGGRVYMGEYPSLGVPKGASSQLRKNITEQNRAAPGPKGSRWMTKAEAEGEFYTWNQKQQSDFVAQGILSGMLKLGDGPMEGAALWKKLVKEASNYGAAGKKVSPIDLMASYVRAAGGTGANAWVSRGAFQVNTQTGEMKFTGPGTYLGNGKAQQTDTRVDLTDPDTARAISTRLFQDLMGRDPGEGELSAFASALHEAEQNNPVVSTTTTQYDMETGQPLSSSTQQSGGLTSDAKAYMGEQKIKKSKEYGAFQAATTYQNAFENLVFGAPE